MMTAQLPISADFLAELEAVFQRLVPGRPSTDASCERQAYSRTIGTYAESPVVSDAELAELANAFETWRRHHQQILHEHLEQLSVDDPIRSPVSLFGTMEYGRLETAHTRVLAWLLDEKEHGFGLQLLEALLRHLLDDEAIRVTRLDRVESEYPIREPTGGDAGRLDVYAEGSLRRSSGESSWRLVIEAKIDAEEGRQQLTRYDDWLERLRRQDEECRVFLTPHGCEPVTSCGAWRTMSFLELASLLRGVTGLNDQPGYHFLRYYLAGVLKDVCRLPVPIQEDCENPYAANEYLRSVSQVHDKGGQQ